MLLKDRCIGVVDLESPELDAFSKRDVEILTLLASQAAVAIENAQLYEEVRANEERLEKEVRFAQRVQAALLPAGPPKRLKGVELAAAFASARELGGDFHDYLAPDSNTLVVAVGDVSGKGCRRRSTALRRGARSRTDLPPPLPSRAIQPRGRPVLGEHHPAPAAARGVLLHDLLRGLRLEAPHRDDGEFRPAVSDPLLRRTTCACRSSWRACRSAPSPARPMTKCHVRVPRR